jgi:hypothetical protein
VLDHRHVSGKKYELKLIYGLHDKR